MENFANNYSTALDGAIDASQTTFDVLSVTGAPDVNFRIKIENELMLVTGVATLTLTVTRGIEGTTGASHADATLVTHVLTAEVLSDMTHGEWTNYTPTLTASTTNPTLGSTTVTGRYKLLDSKTGIATITTAITTGGAWNAGSGEYRWSLPAGWTTSASSNNNVGSIHVLDSGTKRFTGSALVVPGSTLVSATAVSDATGTFAISHNIPVTWATGDSINIQVLVELA